MRPLALAGRGVLVTGAAGGIGTAVAHRLLAVGATPVLLDVPGSRLDALGEALGDRAVVAPADVRDRGEVVGVVDHAANRTGGLSAAVVGAGLVRPDTLVGQHEDDARRVIDVNVYGTLWSFQAAMPHVDAADGHALALSSIAGIAPIPLSGVYPASKAAVDSIVATVRTEAMHRRASAGVVYLGAVDTQMNRDVQRDPRTARATKRSLAVLTRPSRAEDVAAAIVDGLRHRRAHVVVPRWMAPAVWPHTLVRAVAERVMARTALRDELPGGAQAADRTLRRSTDPRETQDPRHDADAERGVSP